jgi:predicted nucleic acid-binding protein
LSDLVRGADDLAPLADLYVFALKKLFMKLYLDVCCLFRPYDDPSQVRVRLEAEAVLAILDRIDSGEWDWVVGEALLLEVARTPDNSLRDRAEALIAGATSIIPLNEALIERASSLETQGFGIFDALHLACAESGSVDVFLTTDDKLIRAAGRLGDQITVRVANPLRWLEEVTGP